MRSKSVVPADALPIHVSGSRVPLWWGMLFLIAIEATVFTTLIVSYFYLYLTAGPTNWPPAGIDPPKLLLPSINTAILLVSSVPTYWADHSIRHGNQRGLLLGLALSFVLGVTFMVIKVLEYSDLEYTWRTHAYGSIVWTITGFHSVHVIALLLKTVAIFMAAWQGYFNADQFVGVTTNGLYWYFVVAIWIPLYATLYLAPYLLGAS